MEKHTPYFKVLEALQKARDCALCGLEKGSLKSHLDAFLYENVNNPGARDALRASHGYCPHHTHHLAGFHDNLAFSILYQDHAALADAFLKKAAPHKTLFTEWANHEICPVCRQAQQIRNHYLGMLAEGLREPEMREALTDRFYFCWNHFLLLVDSIHDERLKEQLAVLMRGRLSNLASRLEQYCQDCQKNAAGEQFESPHAFAWKEALETFSGQKDFFEGLM